MFRRVILLTFSAVALMAVGCLGRNRAADYLQARLRVQEESISEMQAQLDKSTSELQLARREADNLRTQLVEAGQPTLPAEQAAVLLRVSQVKFNSMLTSGLNQNDQPGDDRIVVNFSPYDDDGEVVKLPGRVHITAQDPALPEAERTVGDWRFTAEECRTHWVRGFLGAGYQFNLEPQQPLRNSDLVVHLTLETPDGRSFQATHLVKVRPEGTDPIAGPVPRPSREEIDDVRQVGAAQESPAPRTVRKPVRPTPPTAAPIQDSTNWTESDIPFRR